MSTDTIHRPALTVLSEEEQMFRDAVGEFSQAEIAPKARAMEQNARCETVFLTSRVALAMH